jgi:dTDP-4-dehydrorhamnose reductase
MKILLVGARGMLGRDLQPILSDRHEVIGKDIQDLISPIQGRPKKKSTFSSRKWSSMPPFTDVDGAKRSRSEPSVNACGAGHVARGCRAAGARLIHLSTDYVFDGTSRVPYTEESCPHPLNVYGESKLRGNS